MKVRFTERAEGEMVHIDGWWRENRPAAPMLFREELTAAVNLIRSTPELGAPHGARKGRLVRRVMLRKTRYHVYYAIEDDGVLVLTVWSAMRGRGPDLGETGSLS
jgi:plasmid stabilization system protein ParE